MTVRPERPPTTAVCVHAFRLAVLDMAMAAPGETALPLLLLLSRELQEDAGLDLDAAHALDGLVARTLGLARPWGEVLNELSDRVADVADLMHSPASEKRLAV